MNVEENNVPNSVWTNKHAAPRRLTSPFVRQLQCSAWCCTQFISTQHYAKWSGPEMNRDDDVEPVSRSPIFAHHRRHRPTDTGPIVTVLWTRSIFGPVSLITQESSQMNNDRSGPTGSSLANDGLGPAERERTLTLSFPLWRNTIPRVGMGRFLTVRFRAADKKDSVTEKDAATF